MGAVGSIDSFVEDSGQVVGSFGVLECFEMWKEDERWGAGSNVEAGCDLEGEYLALKASVDF